MPQALFFYHLSCAICGLITLEKEPKWAGAEEFEVLRELQEFILPQQDQEEGMCLLCQHCSCVHFRWNHWCSKASAMLRNPTPQPQNVLPAPPSKPGLTAGGRAEALTGTDTRLIWAENTLISVSVKVAEPIHSTTQRGATSKSSGTCWTLACFQESLENNQTGILQRALGTFCWTSLCMKTVNTNSILFNILKGMMQSVQPFSDLQESVLKAIATKILVFNSVSKPSSRHPIFH